MFLAVEANDIGKAERWLKSWARVKARKGVRSVMDFAKFRQSEEILRLLEEYEHINEFVCATFACDLKAMMNTIALGRGEYPGLLLRFNGHLLFLCF